MKVRIVNIINNQRIMLVDDNWANWVVWVSILIDACSCLSLLRLLRGWGSGPGEKRWRVQSIRIRFNGRILFGGLLFCVRENLISFWSHNLCFSDNVDDSFFDLPGSVIDNSYVSWSMFLKYCFSLSLVRLFDDWERVRIG